MITRKDWMLSLINEAPSFPEIRKQAGSAVLIRVWHQGAIFTLEYNVNIRMTIGYKIRMKYWFKRSLLAAGISCFPEIWRQAAAEGLQTG
jgi:hypothetical protein